jgi:hypothetical protein
LNSILTECMVSMELVSMIKMCLNEMYSKAHVSKHMSDKSPIQMVYSKVMF